MVDISAGFTAIKETLGLLKTINDAKSDYEIKAATSEIQSKLITLQSECFSLGEAVRSREEEVVHLKAKLAKFEDFKSQTEGFVLNQLDSGALIFAKNEVVSGKEVTVYLCPNCYYHKVISILQPSGDTSTDYATGSYHHQTKCHACSSTYLMNKLEVQPTGIATGPFYL